MWKKETSDVLKQSLYFISYMVISLAVVVFVLMRQMQPIADYLLPLFQFTLLTFALLLGTAAFALESKQKGMEYLLSLPYSRLQILAAKFFTRLCAVTLFYVLLMIFWQGKSHVLTAFTPFTFFVIYFSLFLISFTCSVGGDNYVVLSLTSLLLTYCYLGSIYLTYLIAFSLRTGSGFFRVVTTGQFDKSMLPDLYFIPIILLILPFLIPFFVAFRRLDIRGITLFKKKVFPLFLSLWVVCMLASGFFVRATLKVDSFHSYFLTRDLKLIHFRVNWYDIENRGKTWIHDATGRKEVRGLSVLNWSGLNVLEDRGCVFDRYIKEVQNHSVYGIGKIDTATAEAVSIYETTPNRFLGNWIAPYAKSGDFLILLEKGDKELAEKSSRFPQTIKEGEINLVFIDSRNSKTNRIQARSPLFNGYYNPFLFGADTCEERRFWLLTAWRSKQHPILRIWEDGTVDDLGIAQGIPAYINGLLFFPTDSSLMIKRPTLTGTEPVKEIPGNFYIYNRRASLKILDNGRAEEICAKFGNRIVLIDPNTYSLRDVCMANGKVLYISPEEIYFIENMDTENPSIDLWSSSKKFFRVKSGVLRLIREIPTPSNFKKNTWSQLYTSRGGVVVSDNTGRFLAAYAFPDLHEIKFKGLTK